MSRVCDYFSSTTLARALLSIININNNTGGVAGVKARRRASESRIIIARRISEVVCHRCPGSTTYSRTVSSYVPNLSFALFLSSRGFSSIIILLFLIVFSLLSILPKIKHSFSIIDFYFFIFLQKEVLKDFKVIYLIILTKCIHYLK